MKIYVYIILVIQFFGISLFGSTLQIPLKTGWNAIGPNSYTTLETIKNQLESKLLNIQNPDGTKTYNHLLPSQVQQSFTKFEKGVGYWVKVSSDCNLNVEEAVFSGDEYITLKTGWNLIDPLSNEDLTDVKNQLLNKLLNIQNPDGTKTYNHLLPSQVQQSFTKFEDGVGYWIKVNQDISLKFTFTDVLQIQAVNGTLSNSQISYNNYVVKVMTDTAKPTSTAQNVALKGSINGENIPDLSIINSYPIGSKFQLVVFDTNNNPVGHSTIMTLDNTTISNLYYIFDDIQIVSNPSGVEMPPMPPEFDSNSTTSGVVYPPAPPAI